MTESLLVLGVSSRSEAGRPRIYVMSASWADAADNRQGIASLPNAVFQPVLNFAADQQQTYETQVYEVATRLVTLLGTATYDACFVKTMDWTAQTSRELVASRSAVDGAIVATLRAQIPTTRLHNGRELAHLIGGGRAGEAKADLLAALSASVSKSEVDAALAAWAALLGQGN